MPTYILKICVYRRSSSNIQKILALGWDSFGFEYKISIACWLLVILEAKEKKKLKSCHIYKLSVSMSSFQAVTALSLLKALLALSAGVQNKDLAHQWDSPMREHGEVSAPILCSSQQSQKKKRLIRSLSCANSSFILLHCGECCESFFT